MQPPPHRLAKPDDPPLAPCGHMWVFAYGSLIWRPGFDHAGQHRAFLRGYHRRFCLWSHRYRGTPERPGLVLGLDRGGACHGIVFRVPGQHAAAVLRYLDDRELPDGAEQVYHRRLVPVRLVDSPGRVVPAIAYVANRACRLYAPALTPEHAAQVIAQGVGQMGANRDYLLNTLEHLTGMGVRDAGLARIAALLPRVRGAA
ncbi:gamma-glutamylcyclotransferase [Falsiroseomonas bella]|uniref:gamma-glutamylcyclotransferase n=1 Tax=Falsiroseomonas bella TaxID=2184016 RepID=UPI001E4E9DE9|nr:gamma-glutamylcyclotransferase [Falsiroseomonas bella]